MAGSDLTPRFTRHVPALYPSLEELVAAGEQAQALTEHPGWTVLTRLLQAEIDTLDGELDDRLLDTRADYAHRHGRRAGLLAPEQALKALIGRAVSRLEEQRAKHEGDAETSQEAVR